MSISPELIFRVNSPKEFKLQKEETIYEHLVDMHKDLNLDKKDTVFDYCKRNNVKLYSRLKGESHFKLVYYHKGGVGV